MPTLGDVRAHARLLETRTPELSPEYAKHLCDGLLQVLAKIRRELGLQDPLQEGDESTELLTEATRRFKWLTGSTTWILEGAHPKQLRLPLV